MDTCLRDAVRRQGYRVFETTRDGTKKTAIVKTTKDGSHDQRVECRIVAGGMIAIYDECGFWMLTCKPQRQRHGQV